MSEINFTDAQFEEVKIAAESKYKQIGDVQCPFLQGVVSFDAKGLDHIKFKRWNHARVKKDQWVRLKLLHLAPEVIKSSHTLQGIDEGNKFERIKVNSRWEQKTLHVVYYEFISIVKGCRIRIVVKKVDSGQAYFWSIVPYWKQGVYKKKMFEGNPEID